MRTAPSATTIEGGLGVDGNTNIRFDSDGGGDSFVTLATLQGVTTATLADIIHPQPNLVL